MKRLFDYVKGIFPNTNILLMYYSGSIAYGLNDESSDKDITVVLDGFKGNLHLNLGEYDLFVFSRERFIQVHEFDDSIIAYHKAAADTLQSIDKTLIYLNPEFEEILKQLLEHDDKSFFYNCLTAQVDYSVMRFQTTKKFKSHYHILRCRGMIDHFKETGKYELKVAEPWYTYMMEYKRNWDNDIGESYHQLLEEQLTFLIDYRNEMALDGLG